jgi:phosphatidylserine decarboxylase
MIDFFILEVIGALFFFLVLGMLCYYVFWQFWFLRDPHRKITPGRNLVAPADGRILAILNYDLGKSDVPIHLRKGLFGKIWSMGKVIDKKVTVISIFMSPFNVHVNRAPYSGTVESVTHTKGKFYNAGDVQKSFLNEKNEIVLKTNFGRIKVIQIAGFLARRIECFVSKDQHLGKGQRIGLINLGSQVTTIVPTSKIRVKVRKGDRVKAGESIIAEVI